MKKTEIETLIIKNQFRNFLYITIKITDKGDYFLFKSEKLDLSFESTNNNFQESKDEFANELIDLLQTLAKRGELIEILKHYKFELKPENEIIIEKNKEAKEFYKNKSIGKDNDESNFIKLLENASNVKIYDWVSS
ncbi:MAG: hypothetical protein KFW07_02950 [Mycoplasmataceae bacterium]|nr:hypothetical protein [Mycoplasmataceae bacterium]